MEREKDMKKKKENEKEIKTSSVMIYTIVNII